MRNFIFLSVTAGAALAVFLFVLGVLSVLDGDRENGAAEFARFCLGK